MTTPADRRSLYNRLAEVNSEIRDWTGDPDSEVLDALLTEKLRLVRALRALADLEAPPDLC